MAYLVNILLICLSLVGSITAAEKIVIAHRGASGYLPEHTLPAVTLAHAMGADFLEQDVVLSKDDVPVVLHDVVIDTVTDVAKRFPDRRRGDGRYYAIDFTLAELKQLQATERFHPETGQAVFPTRFPIWQSTFQIPTLEEELQLIQGLNKTTGRNAGIYPEIKMPAWHRKQGKDISRIVLDVLSRYGYRTKSDAVFLQCFEWEEVKRVRRELGYQGRLIQLLEDSSKSDPTDYRYLCSRQGLKELAGIVDGIGPSMNQIVSGKKEGRLQITDLVKDAHTHGLQVHPYTLRADALPGYAATFEELFAIFFIEAKVDGVFTDQCDRGVAFLHTKDNRR